MARNGWSAGSESAPSPPVVIEVATSSEPTVGASRVVVVELEVAGPVRVHVAGEHDGVAHLGVDPALGDPRRREAA